MNATAPAAAPGPSGSFPCLGSFTPGGEPVAFTPDAVLTHAGRFREPCFVIHHRRQERTLSIARDNNDFGARDDTQGANERHPARSRLTNRTTG